MSRTMIDEIYILMAKNQSLFGTYKIPLNFEQVDAAIYNIQMPTWKWCLLLGGGLKPFCFYPYLGEMIKFDEHIFQMGSNHQLDWCFFGCVVFFSPQASFHVGSKKDNLQEVPVGCFISLFGEVVQHLGYLGRS